MSSNSFLYSMWVNKLKLELNQMFANNLKVVKTDTTVNN